MKVCDKIKYIRQNKGFSQEEIARKLDMSAYGYGGIERVEVDIKLSRLEQFQNCSILSYLSYFKKNTIFSTSQIPVLKIIAALVQDRLVMRHYNLKMTN